jgi:hypothetical protein
LAKQFEKFANAKEVTQLQPQGEDYGNPIQEGSTNEETNEEDTNEKG